MEAVLPGPAAITLVGLCWDLARLEVRICARVTGSNPNLVRSMIFSLAKP